MHFSLILLSLVGLPVQADTVLVCPQALRPAIEPWRQFREQQGHQVAVVAGSITAEQTRNQIRREAKRGKLRFIVLVGDADLRSTSDPSARPYFLPTHYVTAKVNVRWGSEPAIATDNWYADLDDDQLPDVAIGRLSADTPEQLTRIVRKIIAYERGPSPSKGAMVAQRKPAVRADDEWRRRINLVAGLGGFGALVDTALESAAKAIVAGGIPAEYSTSFTHASWQSPYCPPPASFCDTVVERLNEGCLFWVYMGHGQPRELDRLQVPGQEHSIFTADDVDRLASRRGAPIALFLACYTAAYDAKADCLGEELLRSDRGPVAVIGGSRVTMPYAMSVFGIEMLKEYFVSRRTTIGEMLLHAKRNLVLGARSDEHSRHLDSIASLLSPAGSDLADERFEHVHLFNLLGDPLLSLVHPVPLKVETAASAKPGQKLTVSGTCEIDGSATVELVLRRDRLRFRPARREGYDASGDADGEYQQTYQAANDTRLASVGTTVQSGKFAAQLLVPDDARGDCHVRVFVQGRDSFSAGAADVQVTARGRSPTP